MSSWFEVINEKGKELFSNYSTQFVDNLLQKNQPKVIVAEPPKSNLTADQVAAGMRGSITGLPESQDSMMKKLMIPIVIVIGFVFLAFALKKR